MIEYRKFIIREMLQAEPKKLFVFGDNFARDGYGGQAKEMRDELNSVGIPTKHSPNNYWWAFFDDAYYDFWIEQSTPDWMRLFLHDGVIVWPEDGIGTGLADLPNRAPKIYAAIKHLEKRLGGR